MVIDMSLKNAALYQGCEIEEVAGRSNLITPVFNAVNIVGRNIAAIIADVPAAERVTVVLTGPVEAWAYLVVFHAVANNFASVMYSDGRSAAVTIARHG